MLIDDYAYFKAQIETALGLHIVEKNGRWHVYETSTEPWGLVTAFESEEEALKFKDSNGKYIRTARSSWVPTTLQENFRCCICQKSIYAGWVASLSSVTTYFYTKEGEVQTSVTHEARCLHHIPTRFERNEPV